MSSRIFTTKESAMQTCNKESIKSYTKIQVYGRKLRRSLKEPQLIIWKFCFLPRTKAKHNNYLCDF